MLRRRFLAVIATCASGGLVAAEQEDALWERLRAGGYVLLIRHAATHPGIGDPPHFKLGVCSTQRNLSDAGRRDARAIGAALREHSIPIGPVWSSRWCRCVDTARLAFGRVEEEPALDSLFRDSDTAAKAKRRAAQARIAAWNGQDNLVLVTHDVNIRALVNEYVDQGGIVVTRRTDAGLEVVGRLRAHGGPN
ncbi:histidine phosphatase family protein [Massilia consociata]|uniref:Histidine phosphatase family protein n=1 Tax=Massilia consociata TaxID=760117 RepID=A0ABV6FFH5_9BURK